MAEWFKAAVLKTASPKGDVGSNPTPSAILRQGLRMAGHACILQSIVTLDENLPHAMCEESFGDRREAELTK